MDIINGRILTMEDKIYECGYIRIRGEIIEEVGDMNDYKPQNKPNRVLDVKKAWVMPGLIESHAHIGITSVMVGPGSANVVGGQFLFMKTQGRCIDHMVVKNPAAMKVAFGENPKTVYGGKDVCPSTRMGIAALLRKTLYQAKQYKEAKEKGTLQKDDFEIEPWLPVLNGEIPIKAHAHRADDILTAIRIAKEYQVDMTFRTNAVLNDAGVLFSITTDHPVVMIQYLPFCAGLAVKEGLSLEEGLKAITIYPAKICRVDKRVGSLKKGKDADIAIFTGNPMEIFTKTLFTIIDGKIVYENMP